MRMETPPVGRQRPRRQRNVFCGAGILLGLCGLLWNYHRHCKDRQIKVDHAVVPRGEEFKWDQITPSTSMEYHDCFDGFQCARLEVPMDYHRIDGQGRRMAIALARLPAKVPVAHAQYGGAIVVNPGGPGGSGVSQALRIGRDLQTIVDAEDPPPSTAMESTSQAKYFDIIGFDPRGVNNTTPGFSCFPSIAAQKTWELQDEAEGMLGSSPTSFSRKWQRALALHPGCSEALLTPPAGEDEALGQHLNTPPVVRDMLEITERHAQWREKQGQTAQHLHDITHGHDPKHQIATRTRWNPGRERLLFWGRSYGTVLGTTLATMFPDRISRMVLDGVVDVDRYYSGKGISPVRDADAIFDRFGVYCDLAGPAACPLYQVGGSPSTIEETFLALDARIYNTSVPVLASSTHGPEIITWTDVRTLLRMALYQPLLMFPILAQALGRLQHGDASVMVDFKQNRRSSSACTADSQCQRLGPWSAACLDPRENEPYASTAIMCSDAEYLSHVPQPQFWSLWEELKRDSQMVGDYWASMTMSCVGWKSQSKWKPPAVLMANHTSHPLLLVSNVLDPVTPLINAQKMSRNFPGSAVLQQDAEGHTSASAPSVCTAKAIRRYFQTGALPEQSRCDADTKPLIGPVSSPFLDDSERALLRALVDQMST